MDDPFFAEMSQSLQDMLDNVSCIVMLDLGSALN